MERPKPPCYKDGKQCTERVLPTEEHNGCRPNCDKWQRYEQEYAEFIRVTNQQKQIDEYEKSKNIDLAYEKLKRKQARLARKSNRNRGTRIR